MQRIEDSNKSGVDTLVHPNGLFTKAFFGVFALCMFYFASGDLAASAATQTRATNKTIPFAPPPTLGKHIDAEILDFKPGTGQDAKASTIRRETVRLRKNETLSQVFHRLKIGAFELQKLAATQEFRTIARRLHTNQDIEFVFDDTALKEITISVSPVEEWLMEAQSEKFKVTKKQKSLQARPVFKRGTINGSLFLSAQKAGLTDRQIMQLADIFQYDIDFSQDLQVGDRFAVLLEEQHLEGKRYGFGPILYAEMTVDGQTYKAVRYTQDSGGVAYYTPEGRSLQKTFLRSPLKYSRISSHFNLKRRHPILHKIRAHKGVDFAAPTGTPVKAAGGGRVAFVGNKGGYGRSIMLDHGNGYTTIYAHLHRFASGLREGRKVSQGQLIGYVGSTGLATGPHLHYEFRINGVNKNPLTVKLPYAEPLQVKEIRRFKAKTQSLVALFHKTKNLDVAQQ